MGSIYSTENSEMTIANARQLAKELKIAGRSKMNRETLVQAIEATGVELELRRRVGVVVNWDRAYEYVVK